MSAEAVSLEGIKSLDGMLSRLPQGRQAVALGEKLGIWTPEAHGAQRPARQPFPSNFSDLTDDRLSDQSAHWLSEVFRVTELVGVLEGQKALLQLESKAVRAAVRSEKRRTHDEARKASDDPKLKAPTITQLNDEVEDDQRVQDVDAKIGLLSVVSAQAQAYKEGCQVAVNGISREITFRAAQMTAALRGGRRGA